MSKQKVGYSYLIDRFSLSAKPNEIGCFSSGKVNSKMSDGNEILIPNSSRPDDTIAGHLEFALKNEVVNLSVLSSLFDVDGIDHDIADWLRRRPTSAYARRAAFLFEWLTETSLDVPSSGSGNYVDLVDPDSILVTSNPVKIKRFRVNNNLIGNRWFCPIVRKTDIINTMISDDLGKDLDDIKSQYDDSSWYRANEFFALSETRSSLKIEREEPSESKLRRFFRALHQAGRGKIDKDWLVGIQNSVTTVKEGNYRSIQNWLGSFGLVNQHIDHIPPAPKDLPVLMDAWFDFINKGMADKSVNPIALASMASFGFVYLHPFLDGNGRTHRYLLHDILSRTEFTPNETMLPVSHYLLENLQSYDKVLRAESSKIIDRIDYTVGGMDRDFGQEFNDTVTIHSGHDKRLYAYWDATKSVELVYQAISHVVRNDMVNELNFLRNYDKADKSVNEEIDLKQKDRHLLILLISQNDFHLSKSKRKKFPELSDEDIIKIEGLVRASFDDFEMPDVSEQPVSTKSETYSCDE